MPSRYPHIHALAPFRIPAALSTERTSPVRHLAIGLPHTVHYHVLHTKREVPEIKQLPQPSRRRSHQTLRQAKLVSEMNSSYGDTTSVTLLIKITLVVRFGRLGILKGIGWAIYLSMNMEADDLHG
jgi:hypothetical protein